ncbi:MAG: carboxypeptidase regulatory-like domain-containing protein [Piscinibacter sp.]|nr:carboxypeptidase regulatory-like domain-containing protein [Piscinibacter sp.]
MKTLAALLLSLSSAAVLAEVQDPMMPSAAMLPTDPPAVQHQGAVSVLNGGVGEEEVRWFRAQAPNYPLQLVISGRGGEYGVADSLTLRRGPDELVTVADAGPWVMMDLPPGRYTLEASFDGRTERRVVQVPTQGVERIHWNTLKASD